MSVNELKSVDKLDLTDLSYEHDKYAVPSKPLLEHKATLLRNPTALFIEIYI